MPVLVDFLNQYRAKTTRAMYVSAWVKFLSLLYGARLRGASPGVLDPWVAKYVNDLRNGRRDLAADLQALEGACRTPRTCLGYQSAIRTLLAGENLSLAPKEGRRLRLARKPRPPETRRDSLTTESILKLMEHLDTRGRAILYVLVSSGAGLGEVLSLRLDDLDLDSRPARFLIRDAEGSVTRTAFISREAAGAIRVYLIVRDRFVASARSRGGTGSAHLLFPLGARAFGQIWELALSKARLDRVDAVTRRRTLTPRATRRFFAERMGAVLPEPVVAGLTGGGSRYTEEELSRAYLDGEPNLTLHRSRQRERVDRRIADLEKIVGILRDRVGEKDGATGP